MRKTRGRLLPPDDRALVNPAEAVVAALEHVIDPELGIGIVSLGLVYRVAVDDDNNVAVLMTLTVPGCPMHGTIVADAEAAVRSLPWVREVSVDLTFDPPWSVDRLSEGARKALGRI